MLLLVLGGGGGGVGGAGDMFSPGDCRIYTYREGAFSNRTPIKVTAIVFLLVVCVSKPFMNHLEGS